MKKCILFDFWERFLVLLLYYIYCRNRRKTPVFSNTFDIQLHLLPVQGNAELGQFAFRVTSGEHQCFAALDAGIGYV